MEQETSFGELLRRFRKYYDYTQAETAKRLGYSEETIKSWEQGRRFPAREEVARLAGLMELDEQAVKRAIRVGRGQAQNARTRDTESGETFDRREAVLLFAVANQFPLLEASVDCATWFGLKQTQIVGVINQYIGRASSCDDLQHTVDQEIRAFANIRPQYSAQEYMLSRRQALTALACLPLSLFLGTRYDQIPSVVVEEILPRCAASITACWHLSRGSEMAVIEQALSSYLPFIKTLAQAPSPYQQTAAALTAQSSMLCAILALHRLDLQSREKYARQALHYSRIAQERNLESAALMYLGYTDGYARRPERAIVTFENALSLSEAPSPLSPLLLSDISMGLAEAYAQCQQKELAVKAITLAQHSFPVYPELDPSFLYADCGLSSLYTYEGKMHLSLGQAKEAQQAFAQIERVQSGMSFSERNHTVRVIYQAQTSLSLGDLEMCCAYLEEGRKGAVVLDSRRMSSDIFEVYLLARERWPREQRVRKSARHFAAISRRSKG